MFFRNVAMIAVTQMSDALWRSSSSEGKLYHAKTLQDLISAAAQACQTTEHQSAIAMWREPTIVGAAVTSTASGFICTCYVLAATLRTASSNELLYLRLPSVDVLSHATRSATNSIYHHHNFMYFAHWQCWRQ